MPVEQDEGRGGPHDVGEGIAPDLTLDALEHASWVAGVSEVESVPVPWHNQGCSVGETVEDAEQSELPAADLEEGELVSQHSIKASHVVLGKSLMHSLRLSNQLVSDSLLIRILEHFPRQHVYLIN